MTSKKYRDITLIGKGNSGKVYKCIDVQTGHLVVIKKIYKSLNAERGVHKEYFFSKILFPLLKDNIINIKKIEEHEYYYMLVSDFVDAKDMSKVNLDLPLDDKKNLALKLVRTLKYIHGAHIAHRDIKMGNILLKEDMTPLFIDFEFSCLSEDSQSIDLNDILYGELTYRKSKAGTINNIAPEIINGGNKADLYKADIYSMGVLLYNLFNDKKFPFELDIDCIKSYKIKTTTAPFPSNSGSKIVDRLVSDMMKVDPNERLSLEDAVNILELLIS
jgi:serine/threonine protein kinase